MSIKIAHVSDIHIRKLRYHKEYKVVFQQLYEKLREEKPDIIVNTGDTFHTKLDMSPEAIKMMSDLFIGLADIAPYHMILGNHDMNLKNSGRLDAISPIVEYLGHPNIRFHKYSDVIEVAPGIDLHVLSIVDPEKWQETLPKDRTNIALYHGSVVGSVTDTGWMMTHGDIDMATLEKYDYGLLGDIHKTNQKVDKDGRARYPGSLVQQNHGESNDKGYLIWEIEDKDTWKTRHVSLTNPKPFITIELTQKGRMPRGIQIPNGARLRLVSNNNLPLDTMKRAVDVAKHRFKPETISFLNRASGQRGNVESLTDDLKTENLRDINIQEELIDEYLVEYEVQKETLDKVYELNKKYNKVVEDNEDVSRNINWKLLSFEFDNLFNYGESNSVNFDELSGIVGVFGKNFSGKSSIVDGVLWTLFNSTSKNERKNLNVINQNKEVCRGKLSIQIGEKVYTIERTAKKYTKRLKGEETQEAKTDLNFEVFDPVMGETISLNGLTRSQTDANIRKQLGTLEDFSVSSLSSQHGALAFIDEGSTRRKEIIAKFLDLEQFEQKFKLAKEDSVDLKGALKRMESKNYEEEIEEATENLKEHRERSSTIKELCSNLSLEIASFMASEQDITMQIESTPNEFIDIHNLLVEQRDKALHVVNTAAKIKEQTENITNKTEALKQLKEALALIDHKKLTEDKKEVDNLNVKINDVRQRLININKKQKLLDGIPCGDGFPTCKFIKDANIAVATKEQSQNQLSDATLCLSDLNPETVTEKLHQYDIIRGSMSTHEKNIASFKLSREKNKTLKAKTQFALKTITEKINEYEDNKEVIENLEKLITEQRSLRKKIKVKKKQLKENEEKMLEGVKLVGTYEQKVDSLQEQKREYKDLQTEFAAYDLFMQAMHPNGIAYDVIKKKIPVINQEIAKVLANIVEFEIFFEASGNKFDISIKHPQYDERPIEMASGAEKSLSAMAIRLALLGVSSLPTSDLFILDEPGTALDEDNMSGFIRILELIKVYFKNVLLISHLDSLKDCVDMQIVIEKKDGYARVNQ